MCTLRELLCFDRMGGELSWEGSRTITSARSTVIAAKLVVSVINMYQLLQTEQAVQTRI